MSRIPVVLQSLQTTELREVEVDRLVIAGWTGRNVKEVQAHIDELAKLGVPSPKSTPVFYEISPMQLTTDREIQVIGLDTSGEVECAYLAQPDGIWLGVGSDHTDRGLERSGITISKQICSKPICPIFWRLSEVDDHFDELVLRSWITMAGFPRKYQEGRMKAMLPPDDLIKRWCGDIVGLTNTVMFGGTLAVEGGIAHSVRFDFELYDPVLGRSLKHGYDIKVLAPEA
jgi:hypothetical protein